MRKYERTLCMQKTAVFSDVDAISTYGYVKDSENDRKTIALVSQDVLSASQKLFLDFHESRGHSEEQQM